MKIIAWNVNGIRSLLKTDNLQILLEKEDPDILCLGETKLSNKNPIYEELKEYKYQYWHPSISKSGYSSTAILSKKKPISVNYGLEDKDNIDNEGRVITLKFINYYLIHIYTPNSGISLNRLKWRIDIWDKTFEEYINKLQQNKSIIVCGDLNVAHTENDLKNPKTNLKTAGFTIQERESFNNLLLKCNLIDSFRFLNKDTIKYSFWSYMNKARDKNIGWRIDYFLLSEKLFKKKIFSNILTDIYGSDHAPIKLII
jgi:exodeoxyribonuclease-3